jgi:hypothetical protein
LDALRDHSAACAQLSVKRGGGLRLQRFLKALARRHPSQPMALAFAHTDPPSRAVRRWLDKHAELQCHHFGAAHHWWSMLGDRANGAPSSEDLTVAVRARCRDAPAAKPFMWLEAPGFLSR